MASVSLYSSDQRSDGLSRVLIWLQAHTAASRHVQSCLEDTQHMGVLESSIHSSDGEGMGIIFPKVSKNYGEVEFLYQRIT